MKGTRHALIIGCLFLLKGTYAQEKIMGFADDKAATELKWEKQFDGELNAQNLDTWMKVLSSKPHHLGSPQDKINAEYIAGLFKSWGYETAIESYYVLFPTPKTRSLQLNGSSPYKAKLEEPAVARDPGTALKSQQLPSYNAFSADGNVTAPLVFVNRGLPSDYEELDRLGIDVKGKIVIARYGGSWRGLKPKLAAEKGAVGCIIYSDPADDGYVQGDVYPEGAFRPAGGVQRGSVLDIPVACGDPLTIGAGATKDAKRIERKDAATIMKIPVIPISYEDALPFLKSLKGPIIPPSWRGGLPITYHMGPSIANANLGLSFNWNITPTYNVIAKLKGTELPDEWIIRGNHHDAWVNGAEDPLSGMVTVLEEARGIAEMVKKGMKLKRTLIYCAWDAEEEGLLGSVEWAEDHQKELSEKAVLYLNSDANLRGYLTAAGSHTLEPFINEIANDVNDPVTGVSIKERLFAKTVTEAGTEKGAKLMANKDFSLAALGAGSDWSGFLQHLGVTSLNLAFTGEANSGAYHSIYDSYDLFTRFTDPGFHYGITLSKTAGRVMMRMANASVLPVNYNSFSKRINEYITQIREELEKMRSTTETENKMIENKLFELSADTARHYKPRTAKAPVPYLNFSALENSLAALKEQAEHFEKLYPAAINLPTDKQNQLNQNLFMAEHKLITEAGLPRRPWYRHQIYAPGYFTGYGVKTVPGIREAVEERNWKEAQQNIEVISKVIDGYTIHVTKAIAILTSK